MPKICARSGTSVRLLCSGGGGRAAAADARAVGPTSDLRAASEAGLGFRLDGAQVNEPLGLLRGSSKAGCHVHTQLPWVLRLCRGPVVTQPSVSVRPPSPCEAAGQASRPRAWVSVVCEVRASGAQPRGRWFGEHLSEAVLGPLPRPPPSGPAPPSSQAARLTSRVHPAPRSPKAGPGPLRLRATCSPGSAVRKPRSLRRTPKPPSPLQARLVSSESPGRGPPWSSVPAAGPCRFSTPSTLLFPPEVTPGPALGATRPACPLRRPQAR